MKKKIFIVIAAFNEEKSIHKVLRSLKNLNFKNIVVVDDGSKDNTFKEAEKEGVFVLRHLINRGQGAALKTGIDFSVLSGADVIVTFDADGQHQASEIKDVVAPILSGEADVALGSRFLNTHSNTPFIRRLFLKVGIYIVYFTSGLKLSDSHNGFRAFSRNAAIKIKIKSDRMEHASEIIDEIHKNKLRYKEVPVTITYTDYSKSKGQSTLNGFKIVFKTILRKIMN
ncbi:MAG: glycosyltransferase family 2 protein [Nanoarchaeota archaeon]|nr:glycosyltransferase family 2 protein [Nanoarchaeota archaeon]MBU1029782.1 glycosyltransferase family 2 protein [Nanoarchaeota archaeon]MBU1850303.1 glycosyltransferase family 2 protein [Nanoarchaeota archaeon]